MGDIPEKAGLKLLSVPSSRILLDSMGYLCEPYMVASSMLDLQVEISEIFYGSFESASLPCQHKQSG